MREGRPFVILKAAVSLDGCLAEAPGVRTNLTSDVANRHGHRLRAEVDAIAVGAGTMLVDDPLLTARGPFRHRPLTRVVFDRQLRTPPGAAMLSTLDAGPVVIVTTDEGAAQKDRHAALADAGADVEVARDSTLRAALDRLVVRDIESLIIEGGAAIHAAAWDEGVVDYVQLYVAPQALGDAGVRFLPDSIFSTAALIERRVEQLGPDVLIEGYVHRPY
jgi:diaminohydroxyphosphoribosylaminopyrimidine deaminase/5-amino-6-(5-phosphoribosylamino)uracil reductase